MFKKLIVIFTLCLSSAFAEKPNILFVFTDDHATQAVSAYKYSRNGIHKVGFFLSELNYNYGKYDD